MTDLAFFIPVFAVAAACGAWLIGLPFWAVLATFFFAGPLVVLVAALAHFGRDYPRGAWRRNQKDGPVDRSNGPSRGKTSDRQD